MTDRTKAVVDTSAAEEGAEVTAPLSAEEIAAEIAAAPAGPSGEPPAGSGETVPLRALPDDATALLPASADPASTPLGTVPPTGAVAEPPAPVRHSGDMIAERYRLEECISQAEYFSSWRAVDEKLRRAVGVHLLAAGHSRADTVLAAARSAALLNDPRFVQVLDAVRDGELVYVIREWLPGATDLATLLAAGPLEPYDSYQLVKQVSDAIAAAHRSGRAHLRLTPRCVLRTETGQYRINGLAVDAALRGLPEDDAELTDTRAIGTLLYAALTHRWPYPEDRYDLQGLPKGLGCLPPDQVRAGVHRGLAELAARALCDPPPHHLAPIRTPEELAKAVALLPRIRQPEPDPAQPGLAAPRYSAPQPVAGRVGREPRPVQPAPAHPAPPAGPRSAARANRGRGRRLLTWTVSAVLLAAIGYGSWELVGRLGDTGSPGTQHQALGPSGAASAPGRPSAGSGTAAPVQLQIANVTSFNPYGDPNVHADQLHNTYDGNPNTVWTTEGYYDDLPRLGHGTGLLVDLGSAKPVSSVTVQFAGGSTTAELRVPNATGGAMPTAFGDFGNPVAQGSGTTVNFQPSSPVNSRYLLIWLTSLPKDVDGSYRGQVAEITVTG
ncbi:protein kinase family protein [Kitasatospora sp. NPDC052896]|uniref:protein kinase family protein n=1 Tax=Kitasatospora sp. NPDC052896 TaxID=3364061 RepID=UPI0037CAD160